MTDQISSVMVDVARCARVPAAKHASFVRIVRFAITQAHRDSLKSKGKSISAGALADDFFEPIIRAAKKLDEELRRLQGENLVVGEAARSMGAGHFFTVALLRLSSLSKAEEPIEHLIDSLNLSLVIGAAESAKTDARSWLSKSGRKKGTGYAAHDIFVMALLAASEVVGGKLTIYKTAYDDQQWGGSLLKAFEQLRPFLPKSNFFPLGRPGQSLHTVYQRWRTETGKSGRKRG